MPFGRLLLSKILNAIFAKGLAVPILDLSSGFRLYRASVVKNLNLTGVNFDILQEILIKCFAAGWTIREIPIVYQPRKQGKSKVKLIEFGLSFLRTFGHMWRIRNSIQSADYDDRSFDSRIPAQRYWQRRRYSIITGLAGNSGRTLDIGCGSSRILSSLESAIGLDILLPKLRYARKFKRPLVNGSIWALPFADGKFDCVVCSEVIEHIAAGSLPFSEIRRVLKAGGQLIIGTPDYGHRSWRVIEALYRVIVLSFLVDMLMSILLTTRGRASQNSCKDLVLPY